MGNIMPFWILAERKEDGYSIILRRTKIFLRNDILSERSLVRIIIFSGNNGIFLKNNRIFLRNDMLLLERSLVRIRIFLGNDVLLLGKSLVRIRIRLKIGIDWILRSIIY